ncbi:hypothetical protein RDI58_022369 [Solanum bulbocastanum]|uniref:Uncharacterized protein n=1 Tax=Solanum bulbocastanum TaxID=147425 RepID=A0AAN8T1X3_SOLBU
MAELGVNERILEDSPREEGQTRDPMIETCSPSRIILGASIEVELGLKHVKQPARFKGLSKSKLVDEPTNSDKDDSDFPSSKSHRDTENDEEGI